MFISMEEKFDTCSECGQALTPHEPHGSHIPGEVVDGEVWVRCPSGCRGGLRHVADREQFKSPQTWLVRTFYKNTTWFDEWCPTSDAGFAAYKRACSKVVELYRGGEDGTLLRRK